MGCELNEAFKPCARGTGPNSSGGARNDYCIWTSKHAVVPPVRRRTHKYDRAQTARDTGAAYLDMSQVKHLSLSVTTFDNVALTSVWKGVREQKEEQRGMG